MAAKEDLNATQELEDVNDTARLAEFASLPGTEIMRDVGHVHFARGHGKVLVPQPSSDPSDPLNWSSTWKYVAVFAMILSTFVPEEAALSVAPMYPYLTEEFKLTEQHVSLITGSCVLAQGYANFIIVPYSNIFGRRSASLLFTVMAMATCIWEAKANSYNSLLGARVLNGIATATCESIMIQVVADIFFLHERGVMTGVYFASYYSGAFVGPIIAGNIALRYGWRSFFWLSTALEGLVLVLVVFFLPETKYHRDNRGQQQQLQVELNHTHPKEKRSASDWKEVKEADVEQTESPAQFVGRGKPRRAQYGVMTRPDKNWKGFLMRDIFTPFRITCYPIVLWAALMLAGSANDTLIYNLTESSVFSAAPYHFNPGQVGYANFAFWGGALLGLVTAGPLSDWVASRATKRNNGIREAEMRLPALIPFAITTTIGMVITGVGYAQKWPWPSIIVTGYGACGLGAASMPTVAINYAIDCYKPLSGEIMVVGTVFKNSLGFGMTYWAAPLIARLGYLAPVMVNLALTIGPAMFGIPMYFYGKKLRRLTKDSSLHKIPL